MSPGASDHGTRRDSLLQPEAPHLHHKEFGPNHLQSPFFYTYDPRITTVSSWVSHSPDQPISRALETAFSVSAPFFCIKQQPLKSSKCVIRRQQRKDVTHTSCLCRLGKLQVQPCTNCSTAARAHYFCPLRSGPPLPAGTCARKSQGEER